VNEHFWIIVVTLCLPILAAVWWLLTKDKRK